MSGLENEINDRVPSDKVTSFLNEYMEKKGLSKTQLANQLGYSPQRLHSLMNRNKNSTVRQDIALNIAKSLDVDISDLLSAKTILTQAEQLVKLYRPDMLNWLCTPEGVEAVAYMMHSSHENELFEERKGLVKWLQRNAGPVTKAQFRLRTNDEMFDSPLPDISDLIDK